MTPGSRRGLGRLGLYAVVASLCCATRALAQGEPFVRTQLSARSVTVGQPVTLDVDVFVPSYFIGAPRFPPLAVKDAVAVFVDEGVSLTAPVAGQTYVGQRRSYRIYPQQEGSYEVPAFAVEVRFATEGTVSPRTPVPARGGRFEARIPAAARGLGYFVATPSLELTGTIDRPLAGLKPGDALTRTIMLTAVDAFAMVLPPLSFAPLDGVAVYVGQPETSDSPGERGAARVGRRVESVTYVFEKPGLYRLPAIDIAWWDTSARTLRHSQAPELDLAVAPGPVLEAEIPLPADPASEPPSLWRRALEALRRYGPFGALALILLALALRFLRARLQAWRERVKAGRREREESPGAYLERLEAAARSGRPSELLAATYRWLDRQSPASSVARLDRYSEQSGDPELPALARALVDSAIASGDDGASRTALAFSHALVRAARRPAARPPAGSLEPLNPS
jgi:hypothetical protein